MAILVLFSTVSFTVEKHFCGDVLIDMAIFNAAEKCSSYIVDVQIINHCCKDTVDVIKGQDELNVKSLTDLDFDQQLFLTAFTYSYLNLFEGLPELVVPHKNYFPPNLIADIQVLNQVFII
ncbi:hypothetical protein BZARG_1321 [Bizionia argentinensis JUB59]|uniref:Uncharacterized protein n=1 Tax=Bizionia argentinensis JUB59 TaxID=1046627 RepID=G2EDH1_9FLAO|nr:hypothetical protein [Bizionia argentinensis]EGV43540.1 hypothetical protein BZARG_1321 [Bizionia argentinensis JUB59]